MTLTPRQKKIIAAVPLLILVYLGVTLLLYNMVLEPKVDKLTGMAVSKVNVTAPAPSTCNFTLYENENLISFKCINGRYPLSFLLANYSADYEGIFTYVITDSNDPWKSYNPNLPSWVFQDLSYIYPEKGYWLIMNKDAAYYFDEYQNADTQTNVYMGWNLIGFPRENSTTPALAFSSLAGNYDLVMQYRAENNTWYYYAPGDPNSTLTLIEPDYGYWINMTADDVWVYP